MHYKAHLLTNLGQATKSLRLELDIQNLTEAIKYVTWELPGIQSRINIVLTQESHPDQIVCTVCKENIFNPLKAHFPAKPIQFETEATTETFKSEAGLNPARTIAAWLIEKSTI